MLLGKLTAKRMRLEEASAALLQALQRGFALRRVRAAAISEIHAGLWRAALGMLADTQACMHREPKTALAGIEGGRFTM